MIVIDGSQGEGGGQIFRSSLTLAMCLGKGVNIKNIRAGRKKTGLLRQHLTCLHAAQEICGAHVEGARLGSTDVKFFPGPIRAGKFRFSIGSAGSSTLVFQTVMLPLLFAGEASEVYLEGGTHNGMSPSYDFIEQAFIPSIRQMGYRVECQLERFGFYPAGGGAWIARFFPGGKRNRLDLMAPGEIKNRYAVATSSNLPEKVTQRELEKVRRRCDWPIENLHQRLVNSHGPGNILSLRRESENVTEVVEAIGQRGVSAERVAMEAISAFKTYESSGAGVGEYLADQLLLPMVLGEGGEFTCSCASQHLKTNIAVISQFLGLDIRLNEQKQNVWLVQV